MARLAEFASVINSLLDEMIDFKDWTSLAFCLASVSRAPRLYPYQLPSSVPATADAIMPALNHPYTVTDIPMLPIQPSRIEAGADR